MHDFIYRAIWLQVVLLAIGVPALFVVFLARRRQPGAGEEQPFNGLLRKKSRIRSIAQIGRLGQVDAIKALQPYWNSKDADERYFSLYYSASLCVWPRAEGTALPCNSCRSVSGSAKNRDAACAASLKRRTSGPCRSGQRGAARGYYSQFERRTDDSG